MWFWAATLIRSGGGAHTVLKQNNTNSPVLEYADGVCAGSQVARILVDMAAEDAAHGWRQGGQGTVAEQRRRRAAAANSAGSGRDSMAGSTAGSGKHTALVAVLTANVWPKTQLLLHSLAAISDSFRLLV